MIETKFGEIENVTVKNQYDSMIGKVFKVLHLKEEGCETLDKYVDSLCRKFFGASKLYFKEENLSMVHILSGMDIDSHSLLRSDIFEVIRIIESIKERCDS